MYAVVLAGGGGTRLWPLSTPEYPKPFLPLLPEGSLLRRTVDRLTEGPELTLGPQDVMVVTDQRYVDLVRRDLPVTSVLVEPFGRNTATAVALAAIAIDRPADEVMVVLPADHAIANEGVFRGVLADAEKELALGAFGIESPLVTLGAEAKYPATEYGYLVPDNARMQERNLTAFALEAFEEKPSPARARELIATGSGVTWNAGIFMARRRAFKSAFEAYTPLVGVLEPAFASPEALRAAYEQIEPLSIDYAVMQHAARDHRVVMGAMDVGWSDLGSWTALIDRLAGGYDGAARVVPPAEGISLHVDDLAVNRDESGRLGLKVGPTATITSEEPMGFLPSARQHAEVVEGLLDRVNRWELEVRASHESRVRVASGT